MCGGEGQAGVADVETVALGGLEGSPRLQGVAGADADAVPEGRVESSILYTLE